MNVYSTKECLKLFLLRYKNSNEENRERLIDKFMNMTQVQFDTLNNWVNGKNYPVGLNLVRLIEFLESEGFYTEETARLSKSLRKIFSYIAQTGNIDEVVAKFGYTPKSGRDTLYCVLLKTGFKKPESLKKADEVAESLSLKPVKHLPIITDKVSEVAGPWFSGRIESEVEVELFKGLLSSFDKLSDELSKFLEYWLSDFKTKEDRDKMHDLLGTGYLFNLSNKQFSLNKLLNALCSDDARKLFLSNHYKKG